MAFDFNGLENKLLRAPPHLRNTNSKILYNLKEDFDSFLENSKKYSDGENLNKFYSKKLLEYIWNGKEGISGDGEYLDDFSQKSLFDSAIGVMYQDYLNSDCVGLSQVGYILLKHKGLDVSLFRGRLSNSKDGQGHVFLGVGEKDTLYPVDLTSREKFGKMPEGDFENLDIDFLYPTVLSNIGEKLILREKFDTALDVLNESISEDPFYFRSYFNRANLKSFQGNYSEAIKDYNFSVGLNSGFEFAHQNLSIAKLNEGINKKNRLYFLGAIKSADNALEINDKLPFAYEVKALANLHLKDYRQAFVNASKGLKISPDAVSLRFTRGRANFALKRYKRAVNDFNKFESEGGEPNVLYLRGLANLKAKNYSSAIDDFSSFIGWNQNERKVYFFRGIANRKLGLKDESKVDFKKYISMRVNSVASKLPSLNFRHKESNLVPGIEKEIDKSVDEDLFTEFGFYED